MDWLLLLVLLMLVDIDLVLVVCVFDEGVVGWLFKSVDVGVLLGVLELVLVGGCYLLLFLL